MVVRADADEDLGTGHVLRTLALAQAWRRRSGDVLFIGTWRVPGLIERIRREGAQFVPLAAPYPHPSDPAQAIEMLGRDPRAFLVLDGYHFDRRYHDQIKAAGRVLLVIDDVAHLDHYVADIVVNHSPAANGLRYSTEAYTRCLLGPRYALLREEFLRHRVERRSSAASPPRILIGMGGSDAHDQTSKAVRALRRIPGVEVLVVAGPANPRVRTLRRVGMETGVPVTVLSNISDMGSLMVNVDLAVCGAGTTSLELAFMGVPMIMLTLVENQQEQAAAMERAGAAVNLGWWDRVTELDVAAAVAALLQDRTRRDEMSAAGRELVDGGGADGVTAQLEGVLR